MDKECFRCKKELDINSFPFSKGKRSGICRECKREYDREYHKNRTKSSKEHKVEMQKKRRDKNRLEFLEIKSNLSCKICGESRTPTLDFHHRDPSKKDRAIGDMSRGSFSIESVLKEIEKCDVLCSNCHRMLHYEIGT